MKRLRSLFVLLSLLFITQHVDLTADHSDIIFYVDEVRTAALKFEEDSWVPKIFGEAPSPQNNVIAPAPENSDFLLFQKLLNRKNGLLLTKSRCDFVTVRSFISIRESYISPHIYLYTATFLL